MQTAKITTYDDKDVYFFSGTLESILQELGHLSPYFVCCIFLADIDWSVTELKRLITGLFQRGCVFFIFSGRQAEQAHDIADDVQSTLLREPNLTEFNVIGTSWYLQDSIEKVLFATFICSLPAEDYLEKFRSFAVISLGGPDVDRSIRKLLLDLQSTIMKFIDAP